MIPLREATRRSLELFIDDLVEQVESMPEGPERDSLDKKLRRLEEAAGALEP